jgi:hypothetical protein
MALNAFPAVLWSEPAKATRALTSQAKACHFAPCAVYDTYLTRHTQTNAHAWLLVLCLLISWTITTD